MTTTKILKSLMFGVLLSSAVAQAAYQSIVIALEEGKQVAQLKVGDFNCVLKEAQIRCTPASK